MNTSWELFLISGIPLVCGRSCEERRIPAACSSGCGTLEGGCCRASARGELFEDVIKKNQYFSAEIF